MSGNTVPYQSRDAQWPDYRSQPRELFQTTRLPEPRLQMSLPFDPLVRARFASPRCVTGGAPSWVHPISGP